MAEINLTISVSPSFRLSKPYKLAFRSGSSVRHRCTVKLITYCTADGRISSSRTDLPRFPLARTHDGQTGAPDSQVYVHAYIHIAGPAPCYPKMSYRISKSVPRMRPNTGIVARMISHYILPGRQRAAPCVLYTHHLHTHTY